MYRAVPLSVVYYSEILETSEMFNNRHWAKLITHQTFNWIPCRHQKTLCSLKVFNDWKDVQGILFNEEGR